MVMGAFCHEITFLTSSHLSSHLSSSHSTHWTHVVTRFRFKTEYRVSGGQGNGQAREQARAACAAGWGIGSEPRLLGSDLEIRSHQLRSHLADSVQSEQWCGQQLDGLVRQHPDRDILAQGGAQLGELPFVQSTAAIKVVLTKGPRKGHNRKSDYNRIMHLRACSKRRVDLGAFFLETSLLMFNF